MTRPLALRESQVRAIIRAARKEGARVEVMIGGAVVKLMPDDQVDKVAEDTTLSPLDRWKAARNAGKAYGRS